MGSRFEKLLTKIVKTSDMKPTLFPKVKAKAMLLPAFANSDDEYKICLDIATRALKYKKDLPEKCFTLNSETTQVTLIDPLGTHFIKMNVTLKPFELQPATSADAKSDLFVFFRQLTSESEKFKLSVKQIAGQTISADQDQEHKLFGFCLLYTSPSPRDRTRSRMPSSA